MLLIISILIFIIFGFIINTCPIVSQWDECFIVFVQHSLSFIPNEIPILFDEKLYSFFLFVPQIIFSILFILKKKYFDIIFVWLVPYTAYFFNSYLKNIVQRPRPSIGLHIVPHVGTFSFVSNHTIITFSLYIVLTYYVFSMIKNNVFRYIFLAFAILWSLIMGFSRIWLGVHNPSDVIAAYILGFIFFILFKNIRSFFKKYIGL